MLKLASIEEMSHRQREAVLSLAENPQDIFDHPSRFFRELSAIGDSVYDRIADAAESFDEARLLRYMDAIGASVLFREDPEYPEPLRALEDSPIVLFYKGDISLLGGECFSIVGTRMPTRYGRDVTEYFAEALAEAGFTIVSGLARGVDAISHRVALDKGAPTIAVIGCGVDKVYPAENKELYENNLAIIEQERKQFEKELDDLYKERQAIKAEEKKKADEEKARQEEERRKKEEEEKAREEAEKRQREEDAKKAEQDDNDVQDNDDVDDNGGSKTVDADDGDISNGGSDDDDSGEYVPPAPAPSVGKNAAYGYTNSKSNLTWPVPGHYNISFGFGFRNAGSLYGDHKGIDIYDSQIYNAEICAAEEGTVIRVENYCTHDYGKNSSCGCGGGYGRYCIIEHPDGKWTLYGHANNIIVSVGQHVEKEQVLGYVGSTGHSTGPHTHFEVQVDMGGYMAQVDPSNYV